MIWVTIPVWYEWDVTNYKWNIDSITDSNYINYAKMELDTYNLINYIEREKIKLYELNKLDIPKDSINFYFKLMDIVIPDFDIIKDSKNAFSQCDRIHYREFNEMRKNMMITVCGSDKWVDYKSSLMTD